MFRSPAVVNKTGLTKPPSANKLLLEEDEGEQLRRADEIEKEEMERKVTLDRPFGKAQYFSDFTQKALMDRWESGDNHSEMAGFKIFARTLLDTCSKEAMEEYIEGEQTIFPKPTWIYEFLKFQISPGKSKLIFLLRKIHKAAMELSLDITEIMKVLQVANKETGSFEEFDFDDLASYCVAIDNFRSDLDIRDSVETATTAIVEIVEAMFRAAARMICRGRAQKALAEKTVSVHVRSGSESENDLLHSRIDETNYKLNSMSDALGKLTEMMSTLLARDSEKATRTNEVSSSFSRNVSSTRKVDSTLGSRLNSSPVFYPGTDNRAESSHERKAHAIRGGDTLSQLTGEMKGASQNFEDDALTFNDLFARGSPPGQSFVRLATQPNKYVESLVQGLLLFPLMGLIVQPLNTRAAQSAVDKLGRTVVTGRSFGTTLCRDIVHIQALDKQLTQKDWLPIVNSTTQALPRSLPHLIRFFDEQLESVRDLVTLQGGFKDSGMLSLIENSASLFISNMGEAAAKLLDGIKSPCMSVDGQWRGLLLLFWHQYSQSFSTKRKDFHSIFYPEMLNDNFEENRALLFTDYNWQTQLTCEVGNAMRLTCWNCNGTSDVPFQCCQSTECKKKRVEEENLNIYLGKGGG